MIKPRLHWYQASIALTFIIFGLIFGLVSFVNHYLIKSNSLDLGVANHAVYDFAHFTHNQFTTGLLTTKSSFFADHFSPITILYSPLYYIFGSYTALIIQWAFILIGGLGVVKSCHQLELKKHQTVIILIHFFSIWGIISALSFDFHNNVLAAMLLPWLYFYYCKNNLKGIIIISLLILLCKENMAFWLFFIHIGFAIKNRKNGFKEILKRELALSLVSFIYFYIITAIVMPSLSADGVNLQLNRYSHMGSSLSDIILHMLKNPLTTIKHLFVSHLDNPQFVGIKAELHLMILVSGGFLIFYRPYLILFVLPILGQKLLSNDPGFWGIGKHYSIEFVPILSIALIEFIKNFKTKRWVLYPSLAIAMLTIFFNLKKIEHQKTPWYNKEFAAFYSTKHYYANLGISDIYTQINKIPKQASISASSNLVPHLCNRHHISLFPNNFDADYILLIYKNRNTYPLNEDEFSKKFSELKKEKNYEAIYDNGELMVFKRKNH